MMTTASTLVATFVVTVSVGLVAAAVNNNRKGIDSEEIVARRHYAAMMVVTMGSTVGLFGGVIGLVGALRQFIG